MDKASNEVGLSTKSISRALKTWRPEEVIGEYIWNGFEAGANKIIIELSKNALGGLNSIRITDNGNGISKERLNYTFKPFNETEKNSSLFNRRKAPLIYHNNNGVGRFTFFRIAYSASWRTIYKSNDKYLEYQIDISSGNLHIFSPNSPIEVNKPTGTSVTLMGIIELTSFKFEHEIIPFIKKEFAWFLELRSSKEFSIWIDGEKLNYSDIIGDIDISEQTYYNVLFSIKYIRWQVSIHPEESRYYFLDSVGEFKGKQLTTLNNQGDKFFHSVFITSSLFDSLEPPKWDADDEVYQTSMFEKRDDRTAFNKLKVRVDELLKSKRKPFLTDNIKNIIGGFEKVGAFPKFEKDLFGKIKEDYLKKFIGVLYEAEPNIFSSLNISQKKTFVSLLYLVMESNEKDNLFQILEAIIDIDSDSRQKFADILKTTTMTSIIETVKFIKDRMKVIEGIERLIFDKELETYEVKHLQKSIENHYWIFGEQYNLVAAADQGFEQVLRNHYYALNGEVIDASMDHPDKRKQVDILLVRQHKDSTKSETENVLVELKRPNIKLGKEEYDQVMRYMDLILEEDRFNGKSYKWKFFLIGNSIDKYIKGLYQRMEPLHVPFLVDRRDQYEVFIITWSDLLHEVRMRHSFVLDKLEQQKNITETEPTNATALVENLINNSAKMPPLNNIPKPKKRSNI